MEDQLDEDPRLFQNVIKFDIIIIFILPLLTH